MKMPSLRSQNILQIGSYQFARNAILLKVMPQLRNLRESSAFFKLIKNLADVVAFKSLRYTYPAPAPNCHLVFLKNSQAVTKLLQQTPFEFILESDESKQFNSLQTSASSHNYSSIPPSLIAKRLTNQSIQFSNAVNLLPDNSPSKPISHAASRDQSSGELCGKIPTRQIYRTSAEISCDKHVSKLRRSYFHAGYKPCTASLEYSDLVDSVPVSGMADISLQHPDVNSSLVRERAILLKSKYNFKPLT